MGLLRSMKTIMSVSCELQDMVNEMSTWMCATIFVSKLL